MKRKILTILTLTMSFYIIFSFIIGMLSGIFKSKNPSQKDYLVQLENKSLDDLQDKIDTYQNNILNENNDITYIPKYTSLLWVKIYENVCVINLSKEGFFSGGRYSEDRYVNQLLKTVWSLEEIDSIILYIEGKYSNLSGGVDFSAYSRDSNVLLEGSGVID